MRKRLALLAVAAIAASTATAFARTGSDSRPLFEADRVSAGASNIERDFPARAPDGSARADTVFFGYFTVISGNKYAVQGDMWTWDHGAADPLEGWYARDLSANEGSYFRRITAASWSGHTNAVAAPIIAGAGSAWVGIFEDEADALCWEAGLGYGNAWCQRWQSPLLTYDGAGDVQFSFQYFNNTEPAFDYSKAILRLANGEENAINGLGFDDIIGDPATSTYPTFTQPIFESSFEGQTQFRIVFEMTADGGWSDEDGDYATDYSAFAVDNVTLTNNIVGGNLAYNYDVDANGWTALTCDPIGTLFGINDLSEYTIADECACELSGNVLECHDSTLEQKHPYGQHILAYSPPMDKTAQPANLNSIFVDMDIYGEMPQANGVFYRPGWNYFPFTCPATGATQWSGRVGQASFNYLGDDPTCTGLANSATGNGVPGSSQLAGFIWEVYASCDAFAIAPTNCSGITNFTPIIDNVRIGLTEVANAPPLSFDPGTNFIDGFGQSPLLSPTNAGNADITYDKGSSVIDGDRANLGDSLTVVGPVSGPGWEARLWLRIRREGPSQGSIPNYNTWKTAVADGLTITGATGKFTFGHMDSTQVGFAALKNKRVSEFRENDNDFAGEGIDDNEIIRDGVLAPGTQIQYFITSNFFTNQGVYFYLPDTTGSNFLEFEILPSYRLDAGIAKFPCILTVDANTGNQFFVDNALNVALNGAAPGAPIPNPTRWDRYDYNDASSNWNAPMSRTIGGNNGVNLPQMLGYRQVIMYVGGSTSGAFETQDFTLISDWLTSVVCQGNVARQGFIGNGDNFGLLLTGKNPAFLANDLGVTFKCDAYNVASCGPATADESFCVRVNNAAGSQYPPAIAYDAWGNWCPQRFTFDVLNTTAGGIGNRVYNDYDNGGVNTNYAQVVKTVTGVGTGNYRSVLDGIAYNHLSERDGIDECVGDSAHIVTAVYNEITSALNWIYTGGGGIPNLCSDICNPTSVDDDATSGNPMVTALYQNSPNPFNPRTAIKFSLGQTGQVELMIFDVNGRKVKTLVNGNRNQGVHTEVWDGTDDAGHKVGSGVYWSQLKTTGYESNKKMVILK